MKYLCLIFIFFIPFSSFAAPLNYIKLSETQLYSEISTHTINSNIIFYSPQYPLWTDGASKKRYAYIPEGKQINSQDMDHWVFPNGTKIWKEFSFPTKEGPKRIETRLIEKSQDGQWYYFVFLWNKDENEATIAPTQGVKNYFPINAKVSHDIPSNNQCQSCHGFQNEPLISFAALQLSPERDPAGLHQDSLTPDMITLKDLVLKKKLTHSPIEWPKINSNNFNERRIMGYLHGNCSSCHRENGLVGWIGMNLLYELNKTNENQGFFNTALDTKTAFYKIPNIEMENSYRIKKGSPDQSAIWFRTNSRGNINQMIPFGSKIVDQEFVDSLHDYIINYKALLK